MRNNIKNIKFNFISSYFYYIFKILIIGIILIFNIIFFLKYDYCLNCYKNYNITSICIKCPKDIVFKGLKILSDETTLDEIILKNKSIARFGDGEFKIIFGQSIGFESPNNNLSQRLIEVLNSNEKNLMIGLNIPYQFKVLNRLTNYSRNYWDIYLDKNKFHIIKLINKKKVYYSATISRFYIRYKDKTGVPKFIKKLKKIWNNKNILIIEGQNSRTGVGNDLLNNSKSIKRIICPNKNAFRVYDKIIKKVISLKEKRLILIALGPTATILAYDLYKLGYHTIDIGHVDLEYEWFLRNCTTKIQIENKNSNEVLVKKKLLKTINGKKYKKYNKQIIYKILD